MKVKVGAICRDLNGTKCHIVNTFNEGKKDVVTYKYWAKEKQRWIFKTDFTELFLIGFKYGWTWGI